MSQLMHVLSEHYQRTIAEISAYEGENFGA